ncbi:hypothetical protein BD779DRAFT_1522716 [Infundibulicybe gibba]|nr:hypothetical protein BD779DRAFT_1522716 [Infundibulicybe gibba]
MSSFTRVDGSLGTYSQFTTPKNITNIALHLGQMTVADSALLYRLYIVWGRSRWIILLPLTLTIELVATGCGVIYSFTTWAARGLEFWMVVSFFGATLM